MDHVVQTHVFQGSSVYSCACLLTYHERISLGIHLEVEVLGHRLYIHSTLENVSIASYRMLTSVEPELVTAQCSHRIFLFKLANNTLKKYFLVIVT